MKFLNEYNVEMVNRTSVYKEKFPKAKLQMEERLRAFVAENGPLSGGISQKSESDEEDTTRMASGSGSANLKVKDSVEEAVMRSRRSTVRSCHSWANLKKINVLNLNFGKSKYEYPRTRNF